MDGFDFAGLVSMQTCDETWPATAGLVDQSIGVMQALNTCTKVLSILADDDDENPGAAAAGDTVDQSMNGGNTLPQNTSL